MYGDVLKKEKDVKEKELKEKEKRSANAACNFSNQPRITTLLQKPKVYDKNDIKCKTITKKLSVFLAATNVPISLVEDPYSVH